MSKNKLVFGTDPEFFAGYSCTDGKLYCLPPVFFRMHLGVDFTPNGRHPIFVKLDNGTVIHEDGAAFEMALTPSVNPMELFDRVKEGKKFLEDKILKCFPSLNDGKVYTVPTINYEIERWKDEGEEFKMCTEFGCDPDEDVDDMKTEHVEDASLHPYRYGGGHIHLSGSKMIKDEPILAVHSLAMTAGLAAIAYSDTPELDKMRTYRYGRPRRFRIQKYGKSFNGLPFTNVGIEYRTPSNRWTENRDMAQKVFEWAEIGIKYLLEKNLVSELINEFRVPVTEAILSANQRSALNILDIISVKI